MDCSTPGFPVLHCLLKFAQTCPLSWWCHPTISSSVSPFSSCPQSSQHQGFFQWVNSSHPVAEVLELQSFSTSVSVPPMNMQDWFPLGWTGLISLLSKGHPRVVSNTTIRKHLWHSAFFMVQLSYVYTTSGKTIARRDGPLSAKRCLYFLNMPHTYTNMYVILVRGSVQPGLFRWLLFERNRYLS